MNQKDKQVKWAKIKEDILAMKAEGMTIQEIADKRNRKYNTIRTLLKKYRSAERST